MDLESFSSTINQANPPVGLSVYLQSLWYDARGDWNRSHNLVQHLDDAKAAHIHAYLHRKEGDAGNARYWYSRAGIKPASGSLEEEWKAIVTGLLN